MSNEIPVFVFGSNKAGLHGAGAALFALKNRGAIYGQGYGLQGNSFAIPTKDARLQTLPIAKIFEYVKLFKQFAMEHPELKFQLTPIGCGLAGYRYKQIGPMFKGFPENVIIPFEFEYYVK